MFVAEKFEMCGEVILLRPKQVKRPAISPSNQVRYIIKVMKWQSVHIS